MKIQEIVQVLETVAPPALQESYDNSGLLTGQPGWECKGILVSLDCTSAVLEEAIEKGCNMIVAHHPILFKGLKKITGSNYVEQTLILAIKHDIAIYAIHTNLDNTILGVSGRMADLLGLENRRVLVPKENILRMLSVFVPQTHKEKLLNALFEAGAGEIGNYSECSFAQEGEGSFKPGSGANPFVGQHHERHIEKEVKLELVFEYWRESKILQAMKRVHPYEEIAFQIYQIQNTYAGAGAGITGDLPQEYSEAEYLSILQNRFQVPVVKHSPLTGKKIKKVALCGGAGSFAIPYAKVSGSDVYITGDLKYHEYFDAEGQILLADIGHYESEQFTIDLLVEVLSKNFTNFAVLKTGVQTNPVHYFQG